MPRLAYLIITAGCLITAVTLYIYGYHGYSALMLIIGLASAINLRP